MKWIAYVGLCAIFLAGCQEKADAELIHDAEEAVKNKLQNGYNPGECAKWMYMDDAGVIKSGASKRICDMNFNVARGLTFSDIKVYRGKDRNSVCGIVSGFSDISRIGGRFVYNDKHKEASVMKSKYPGFHGDIMKIISTQHKNEADLYCK